MSADILEFTKNTPDPDRASRNLERMLKACSGAPLGDDILHGAATLFAYSQYLANYSINNPDEFLAAYNELSTSYDINKIESMAQAELQINGREPADVMGQLRRFRMKLMLRITLRDVLGVTDVLGSMRELSALADCLIKQALNYSIEQTIQKFGAPETGVSVSLIALGKLGGSELNYSSDIDVIGLYRTDEGKTEGVVGMNGVRRNRVSAHEFYVKVMEMFNQLLAKKTDDGVAYRVDLRLRPQGRKGELILPLKAYATYYESWGRTWERMVLLRARPVAGDDQLGRDFIKLIEPFVWRSSADLSEIDEIRAMKKKIDSSLTKDDIKRGYGGIRELEFFVQTFQLIYGATERQFRVNGLDDAINTMRRLQLIPVEDLDFLWENYLYLRRLEHYLQMVDDLQTHTVPANDHAHEVLSKKLGYPTPGSFLADLRVRRMKTKNMYNTLLGSEEDVYSEAQAVLMGGGVSEGDLLEYLAFRGARDPKRCLSSLNGIKEQAGVLKTQQEVMTIREVVPEMLEKALASENPDRALSGLESLFRKLGLKVAYLTALTEKREFVDYLVKLFALSTYLSRVFLSTPSYFNLLIEEMLIRKSLEKTEDELDRMSHRVGDVVRAIGQYKRLEEVRIGALYLSGTISTGEMMRYISHLADAIITLAVGRMKLKEGFAVIAFGKLGGRESTFGSDLDMVFVSESTEDARAPSEVIKILTSYTELGMPYAVDMRLRPDGTKGVLAMDLKRFRDYYMNTARPWEIQALLKARPVAGDPAIHVKFMEMAREVVLARCGEVGLADIRNMRKQIVREHVKVKSGLDIKLVPGGLEELEFFVQGMQLKHCTKHPDLLVQNTRTAINRLLDNRLLDSDSTGALLKAYEFYRKLQTLLRLNEEKIYHQNSGFSAMATAFMGLHDEQKMQDTIQSHLDAVLAVVAAAA